MKDKADNSRGRKKCDLTQAYKSYADYAFPNDETHHPRFKNVVDSILCTRTNDGCQFPNWKSVLTKCTLPVLLLLSHELKDFHQTEHQ